VNSKVNWAKVALSLLGGLFGGMAPNWLSETTPVLAQNSRPPKVIRAERLELVGRAGNVRAFLDVLPDGTPRLRGDDSLIWSVP